MMRVVQTYWRRLDHEATAANAEAVLLDYRHRKQKSKRHPVSLQSPAMDGMPHSPGVGNAQEDKILRNLDDEEFYQQCDRCIDDKIESDESRMILHLLYRVFPPLKVQDIMQRMGMETTAYYHAREDALIAFAEVWPPSPSELLVYRTEKRA